MKEVLNVKITVDGKTLEAPAGQPLIQAILDQGTMVPHFCYHPGIGIEGSCRLCLVEVKGMPKLATSCTVPVKEGMEVVTHSAAVEKARKGVLEFFLLNHPLDCPFCDKGGECPLQNFTLDSGQFTTRFTFQKLHKAKHQVIGDHIMLDKERCVLCDRCVRFGRDLAGHEELQIGNRGSKSEIFVPEGRQLESKFTGNYADMCPVGALTSRDFRFKARPWELKAVNTLCGDCSVGCNVQAWHKNGDVLRLTPRVNEEVNEWWLCDQGRYGYKIKDRVLEPQGFEQDEDLTTQLLQTFKGAHILANSSLSNEEFFLIKQIAKEVNAKVFVPFSQELKSTVQSDAYKKRQLASLSDLEKATSLIVVGEDLEVSHPVLALRVRRLVKNKKLKVTVIHSQKTSLKDVAIQIQKNTLQDCLEALIQKEVEVQNSVVFISDACITSQTQSKLTSFFQNLNDQTRVKILLEGSNAQGLVDQWDDAVLSLDDLKAEGKCIAFGPTTVEPQLQFVLSKTAVHPKAKKTFPLSHALEKTGTFTNTFGIIQKLEKSSTQLPELFQTMNTLKIILNALVQNLDYRDLNAIYQKMAHHQKHIPATLEEIPVVQTTYHHYERAAWPSK